MEVEADASCTTRMIVIKTNANSLESIATRSSVHERLSTHKDDKDKYKCFIGHHIRTSRSQSIFPSVAAKLIRDAIRDQKYRTRRGDPI